jgi:hypothetical protein
VTSSEFNLAASLIGVHWAPLLLAAWLWPLKPFSWSFGSILAYTASLVSCLIVLIFGFIFLDVRNSAGTGSGASWYLIYSMMTLGLVPISVIAIHVLAGRFAGFFVRRFV